MRMKNRLSMNRYSTMLYLFILILNANTTNAQVNFVQNGGFEQYSKCPYNNDQIKFAMGWQPIDTINAPPIDSFGSLNCTPEYCNVCSGTNTFTGVPYSGVYHHYPHAGNGMSQVLMYFDESYANNPNKRDYLQNRLVKTLTTGKPYCVTFYVTLEQASGYAINHIGAYFDNGSIDTTQNCGLPQTTHVPQVQTLNVVSDTLNWTKIEGGFTATGTEKYITIGNFYDKAHTNAVYFQNTILSGSHSAFTYYLVDDVSVVESATPAYAGGDKWIAKGDSVFIGRNEVVPDCMWYRNGVLIDTVHAGFWVKDTVSTTYLVKQSICGNVLYDSMHIHIAKVGVGSVGNESIFKVYPNPAGKEITIQTVNNVSSATLAVYGLSGRVMMMREVGFVNGETHVPLDLPGGVYVIELVNSEGVKNIQRLIIL
jgi:hypothetical protein